VPGNAHPAGAHTPTILALALVARLLILWFALAQSGHTWLFTRGIELGTLAQCLLEGRGLSSPFGGSTGPTALLAPGYPAIIACIFRVFGSFTLAAAIAIMVQHLLFSVLTVWMIVHVAQRCFGARGQPRWSILGAIAAAAVDADDLLGNLLIHAAAGEHDCRGTPL
jgi:hypothetical protein